MRTRPKYGKCDTTIHKLQCCNSNKMNYKCPKFENCLKANLQEIIQSDDPTVPVDGTICNDNSVQFSIYTFAPERIRQFI